MQKTIRVGPFDEGWAWWFTVDGHLVDQGYDLDVKEANRQAHEAARGWHEAREEVIGDGRTT